MLSHKGFSLILLTIVFISFIENSFSLKFEEKGVCEELVTSALNDLVDDRRLKLPNVGIRKVAVCCIGYLYDAENDQCEPICSQGCVNGTCTDVDTCTCTPPLTLVGHVCVPATCSNCEHGICIAPNVCKCYPGYERIDSLCKPICDSCSNGNCIAPNNCTCFEGYERINNTCMPKCSSCSNGDCTAPNNCSCHPGYVRINSICKPMCSSCDEEGCVSSETCQVTTVPSLEGDGNTPTCSPPCTNGNCPIPNQCFCNKDYNLVCSVVCQHGYCSRPGNCTCKPKEQR